MKSSSFQKKTQTRRNGSANRSTSEQTSGNSQNFADLRPSAIAQRKMVESIQRMSPEEEELAQAKVANSAQLMSPEEEEPLQGKGLTIQRQAENATGIPDGVKNQMESSFNTDFSGVRIHQNSSQATNVGALAYTQGADIHFAPGQFKPNSSSGQQLLGHELTHVVQQSEGRVKPTTEVGGLPVNDDPGLESEADVMGKKAAQTKIKDEA